MLSNAYLLIVTLWWYTCIWCFKASTNGGLTCLVGYILCWICSVRQILGTKFPLWVRGLGNRLSDKLKTNVTKANVGQSWLRMTGHLKSTSLSFLSLTALFRSHLIIIIEDLSVAGDRNLEHLYRSIDNLCETTVTPKRTLPILTHPAGNRTCTVAFKS